MNSGQTAQHFVQKVFAWAGLLSPIVLAAATIIVAAQRQDYSQIRDPLSELGAVGRPAAIWMNVAGIIPAGLLTALAAVSARRVFGAGVLSRSGMFVQILAGCCLAGTAVAPWIGAAGDFSQTRNILHVVLALSGFLCLAAAPFLFGLAARRNAPMRKWSLASIIAAVAVFAFAFLLSKPPYAGLFQRAALATFYLWLVAVSINAIFFRYYRE